MILVVRVKKQNKKQNTVFLLNMKAGQVVFIMVK